MRKNGNNHQYLCSQLVTVEYVDQTGHDNSLTCNLEEISSAKLSILSDSEVPHGSPVVVLCQGHRLRGHAQNPIQHDQLGWFYDVRLVPKSRWSKDLFLPEFLLDLPIRTKAAATAA